MFNFVYMDILFTIKSSYFKYLSSADDRLLWQSHSLPADDLCTENAVMLKRFNRYPLIIDPSGQATEFLLKEYAGKKITKTRYMSLITKQ